jgi:LysR family transcriptional regulator, transcriptional activator of the cysJI operon
MSGDISELTASFSSPYNMPMEDHRLKAFCLIVETGSFSKAASAKFMTQSAMSHLIKNLEEEIGVRLLNRQGKNVIPTPAGKVFYEHAKQILEQYRNMENGVYAVVQKVQGRLSIGASVTAATYLLPQVFYNFIKIYPEVEIDLSVGNTERILSGLIEGKIDAGIVEGKIRMANICLKEIADDEVVVVASENHPLVKKQQLTIDDLISQPFIMPAAGSGLREFIDDFFADLKTDPQRIKIIMTLGNPELIIRMVQSGIGISFVSKWSAFRALKDESVKLLPVSNRKLRRNFYLACMEKEPSTMTAKTFLEFIKGYQFFIPF